MVLNNKEPAKEMRFGEDIYALAVAMLHKKNARHLGYFDKHIELFIEKKKTHIKTKVDSDVLNRMSSKNKL